MYTIIFSKYSDSSHNINAVKFTSKRILERVFLYKKYNLYLSFSYIESSNILIQNVVYKIIKYKL